MTQTAERMVDGTTQDLVAGATAATARARDSEEGLARVDAQLRVALLAIGLGATDHAHVAALWQHELSAAGHPGAHIGAAVAMGSVGAGADLDALDVGPAHLSLPVTVAVLEAQLSAGLAAADPLPAVAFGIEVGARCRRSVVGVRPGAGFHSVGVFGTVAASAGAAYALGLDARAIGRAISVGLTRAAGLSFNNAATWVGLTHFGWAAGHGVEAALFARDGMAVAGDLETALTTLAPGGSVDPEPLHTLEPQGIAADAAAFKWFPCNIYLNPVCLALERLAPDADTTSRITLTLPPVRHLDMPDPADVREARNSAQAVVAMATTGDGTYRSFSAWDAGRPAPGPLASLARILDRTTVTFDPARATDLRRSSASVLVVDRDGERQLECGLESFSTWDPVRARHLSDGVLPEDLSSVLFTAPAGAVYARLRAFLRERCLADA